jgi:hypothetical protein
VAIASWCVASPSRTGAQLTGASGESAGLHAVDREHRQALGAYPEETAQAGVGRHGRLAPNRCSRNVVQSGLSLSKSGIAHIGLPPPQPATCSSHMYPYRTVTAASSAAEPSAPLADSRCLRALCPVLCGAVTRAPLLRPILFCAGTANPSAPPGFLCEIRSHARPLTWAFRARRTSSQSE